MENKVSDFVKITVAQLIRESVVDDVQIGLIQGAGRRCGLKGEMLAEFVAAVAEGLIFEKLSPGRYEKRDEWHFFEGEVDDKVARVKALHVENPEDGYSVWFRVE